jgi:hypothetical protein
MCTIADAKVRQNYNCYNVYFNECLLNISLISIIDSSISVCVKAAAVLG